MGQRFYKYEGLGNDFILIEALGCAAPPLTADQAKTWCDRRRGVGADGVLSLLRPAPGADARMHIFNADGSVAEMCGNGLRCAVLHELWRRPEGGDRRQVDTGAGRLWGERAGEGRVRLSMGPARRIYEEVRCEGVDGPGLGLSMGNPHLVLPSYPPGTELWTLAERLGPALERHPSFPQRTNVGFMRPREGAEAAFDLVVFERGSGITQACGTGASAAAVAAWWRGELPGGRATTGPIEVAIHLPGGPLQLQLHPEPAPEAGEGAILAQVEMVGPARRVFSGEL